MRRGCWFVIGTGFLVMALGWYLAPDKWGYGCLGFGFAHLIFGMLLALARPDRVSTE